MGMAPGAMDGASEAQLLRVALLFAAFVLWLLLPLIPALLIHRLLPDNAIKVDGPLQGLKVNASGGIASYLLIVLLAGAFIQTRMLGPINSLDDGSWEFDIPIVVQDARGESIGLEGGAKITVEDPNNPEVAPRVVGMGYTARLTATKSDRNKLPTIYLVGHLPSGMKAVSAPIDLNALADGASGDEVVQGPLTPLRVSSAQTVSP
jgi:hypothetical protein